MRAALALAGLLLAGCATDQGPPQVKVVVEKVPVVLPCVPSSVKPPPAYPDTDEALKAAPGPADRYRLTAAGRTLREQRLSEIEPVIQACRVPTRLHDGP